MVGGVHRELRQVAELAGLAGLDGDARVRVHGRVVGLVGGVLAAFVVGSLPKVLLQAPLPVAGLDLLQLIGRGGNRLLLQGGFVKSRFSVAAADGPDPPQVRVERFPRHLQLQGVHGGVGLDQGRVHHLGVAGHHARLHAQGEHAGEDLLEERFGQKLAGARDGRVPGQRLVELVAQEVEQVQPQAAVLEELPVGDDVLQVAHQAELEEHHRIDRVLAAVVVVMGRQPVEELQVQPLLKPTVEVALRNMRRKREKHLLFIRKVLPALHRKKILVEHPFTFIFNQLCNSHII